jgi:hypothetical protein
MGRISPKSGFLAGRRDEGLRDVRERFVLDVEASVLVLGAAFFGWEGRVVLDGVLFASFASGVTRAR